MFSSPRLLVSSRKMPLAVFATGLIALLLGLASVAQAQQLSIPGFQAPVEKKSSARQEVPVEIRAARGEAPLNRLYDYVKVEQSKLRHLPLLDPRRLEEAKPEKKLRIGVVRTFSRPINVSTDAALYRVSESDVRVIGLVSEGALYTRVHFTGMSLPAGARVFVYSLKNADEFYGPFEGRGPSGDGTFWTPPVEGDEVAIEYFTPNGVPDSAGAPFQVSAVSHIYRSLFKQDNPENIVGVCNVEVSSEWSEVAKSVGYLEFTTAEGEFSCTGTLLNTSSNDQTPYLLTANHCFDQQSEAQTLRVYWFYNSGDAPPAGTPHTDGANLLSTSSSSDFSFVRLTGTLPGGLFFSGWDASQTPLSTSITGIHHPKASHKRISFGSTLDGCDSSTFPGQCKYYTTVHWNSGTTEPGSSGSGIWKGAPSDSRLVGTLTGGESSCSNPSGTDYYGSFSQTYPFISSFLQRGDNGADDNLEENDTRAQARALESGTYSNLVVKGIDEDWYRVSVVAGGIVSARIDFTHSSGNINMQLFRGNDVSPVSISDGTSDVEKVSHINQSGGTQDYYLRVLASPGVQNSYTLIIGGTGAVCAPLPINYGQTINGSLSSSDCQSASRPLASTAGNFYSDRYYFTALQGQQISVTMTPTTSFNTFLIMQGVISQGVYSDPQNAGKAGSVAEFIAPATGTYTIEATSYDAGVTGNYQLTLNERPDVLTISQTEFNVREDAGRAAIVVNRGPNASGAASVDYATSDFSGLIECSRVTGSASPRCDYASSVGTLRFAAGEKSKTIFIPIVDDSFAEGTESFELNLSNPVGAGFGSITRAVVIISDNEAVTGANPVGQTPFFVRQHYIDFLGREPDPAGYQSWQATLNNCAAGDTRCDRIEVSSGFFRSPEFQERGYFVYRFYSVSLGRKPNYAEFMPDIAKVSGFLTEAEKEANKVAFVDEFMARTAFKSRYDSTIGNPTAYVDALLQTAGLQNHPSRAGWIAGLQNGTLTRARVLRELAESQQAFDKYYTEAFVVMQYFGYLRRDPDKFYLEWINIMNQDKANYRNMVNGFVNSLEYRLRFGQ